MNDVNAIELNHISKKYKEFQVEDVSFTVPKGYITGFIGPNGSGKSTIIRMILDAVRPDEGDIRIFNEPNHKAHLREKIGFVYDTLHIYEDFNLKKAKAFISEVYPSWDDDLYQKYVDRFELPERKKLKKFSKGMKMKASLLFALSHRPELIIMDEPTAGLDPIFRRELLDELQNLMINENQSIFFSTHITQDLDQIADHIVFIYKGRLQFQKTIDEIRSKFFLVKGQTNQLDADLKKILKGYKKTSQNFTGLYEGDPSIFEGLEDEFIIEQATLEDIMYYTTRRERAK